MENSRIRLYVAITLLLLIVAGPLALILIPVLDVSSPELVFIITTGFLVVGICYLGFRRGLWSENTTLSDTIENQPSSAQWILLQSLACFAVIYGLWYFITGISLRPLKPIYIFETLLLNSFTHNLIFILWITACIITVFRTQYGARFLLVTCLWMLTLELPVFSNFVSYLPISFNSGSVKMLVVPIGLFRWWLLNIAFLAALAVVSTIVARGFSANKNRFFNKISNVITYKGSYLYIGILLAFYGIGIQWYQSLITATDLRLFRTLVFTAAAIAVMSGHLFSRNSVLIPATIVLPIILLADEYFGDYDSNVVPFRLLAEQVQIWIPLILLGLFYAFKKNLPVRLRVAVFLVPVTFMLLSYFVPHQKMISHAPAYPDTFPSYLEPPEDAKLLSFSGGYDNYRYDPPNFVGVCYEVNDPCPALRAYDYFAKQFEIADFSKLDYQLEFPETPLLQLEKLRSRNDISDEGPSGKDFVTWDGYWLRKKDNMLLKVHLWYYDQKTEVTIEASSPIGWSHRAIKLRHQILFYKQIRDKNGIK